MRWRRLKHIHISDPSKTRKPTRVNENKQITLPPQLAKELGIVPDDEIRVDLNGHGLHLRPSVHALKRVYVEVTNTCNLNCSTCMRNVWDVKYGHMSSRTFDHLPGSLSFFSVDTVSLPLIQIFLVLLSEQNSVVTRFP